MGKTAQIGKTAETTTKAAKKTAQESKLIALFLKRHWKGALIVSGIGLSASFDCSGFVSYVLINSGLCNTGWLSVQRLYNIFTPVSDPLPGNLMSFVASYDTSGMSPVGIYVGDGMILHCGDSIQYSTSNTNYWQSHFYVYGRPPYN